MCDTPSQRHLCPSLVVFLADLHQTRLVHQLAHLLSRGIDFVLVAERRVLCEQDAVFLVPGIERRLLQPWMHLQLMCSGNHTRLLQQLLHLCLRKVRHSDGLRFTLLEALLHGFIGLDIIGITDESVSIIVLGEHRVAGLERLRPMHEKQIHIVGVQVFQTGIQSRLDIFGGMGVVP